MTTAANTEYYVKLYAGVQIPPIESGKQADPWGKVVRYSRNARIYK